MRHIETPLRLSWSSYQQYELWSAHNTAQTTRIWLWHETCGDTQARITNLGICNICTKLTHYTGTPESVTGHDLFRYRMNWWGGLCCDCGFSALERTVLQVLKTDCALDASIYHVGHFSRFRAFLSNVYKNTQSSQYKTGIQSGTVLDGVRYEDITGLTFPDETFDCVVCMEILEHLPDYNAALAEVFRITKSGGMAIFSFPWLGGSTYEHLIRAEQQIDGSVRHILPPEYHGDPATQDGILSYRAFGWKILDELTLAGFNRVSATTFFSPLNGYMSILNPIILAFR